MCKDGKPNFIPVSSIVFELSCSQTDIIPKLCFSDSGRSKTWRFVKISSSNFFDDYNAFSLYTSYTRKEIGYRFFRAEITVGHQPQQMALPSCVRSEDEAVENREETTRRDERRWFGSSSPKHEMKRRDDLKDDIRC
ncbi:hypothetical protein AVEN_101560-1 [Araneus ventricosus]|uniref:Uncharacterized protein n=1 Tax=Araneus ventricosus TaxID=182803 RepID=A0A4Y2EFZ2_ARAVE|nr:hypothetical protein AVEN_101560-1 [Araneus ventricosus]